MMAVLTVVGAVVSWWRSNLSKDAKEKAEAARDDAQKTLDAVVRQADAAEVTARSVDSMAKSLSGPPLTVAWLGKSRFAVRNNTQDDMVVTSRRVDGSDRAVGGLEAGTAIRAGQSVEGFVEESAADVWTKGLELGIEGRSDPIYLSFAERPR